MINTFLSGIVLFGSLAFRSPNVQPNPDDYEVSIGFQNDHYYFNRQWERELGEKYIDDLFWAKLDNGFYFKPEYMNKESRNVKYLKLDWRRSFKGFSCGFTTRSINDDLDSYETFLSGGWSVKKTYQFINPIEVEFNIDGYLNPNENGDLEPEDYEYENKFKVSWKINDRVRLYKLGQVSKLKGNNFYKAKFGVELSL